MKPIIKASNVSKQYRIGAAQTRHDTLRERLVSAAHAPLKRLRGNGHRREEMVWAVKDVSFEIAPGEVVGIIGHNGAGKSTLLKILSRITEPTSGRIELYGRVGSLLEVGTGFHPELTGRENIYLNGAILGMARIDIERRFDEIVAFAEVEKFLDTPVKRYSSGMYLRLAFAVAAHLDPEILIIDEVLAVGDAAFQRRCLNKMEDASRSGRTVLFVSHNMSAIQRLCKETIVLDHGRVVLRAPSREAVEVYLSGAAERGGEIKWAYTDAERESAVALPLALRIRDHNQEVATQVRSSEEFTIEVEYLLRERVRDLRVGIFLYAVTGECIFGSFDVDEPERHEQYAYREPGHYTNICHIPANLLGQGKFTIGLNLGIYSIISYFSKDNLLVFDVDNTGSVGSQWQEPAAGYLRPKLDWEIVNQNPAW
ncbi:MAG: ABC transporter ATP-binding protein [Acidobacteria bacterium]|nr:ABC transporter ATP-binding protein [Acidobacteriota bacterium]